MQTHHLGKLLGPSDYTFFLDFQFWEKNEIEAVMLESKAVLYKKNTLEFYIGSITFFTK